MTTATKTTRLTVEAMEALDLIRDRLGFRHRTEVIEMLAVEKARRLGLLNGAARRKRSK